MPADERLCVFDLHCDTVDRLGMAGDPIYRASVEPGWPLAGGSLAESGAAVAAARMHDADGAAGPPGAQVGWCQCYAIWIPDIRHSHDAFDFYRRARNWFADQMLRHADRIEQVRDAGQIGRVVSSGKVAAILTVENGLTIGHSVRAIDELVQDGVRMVTLTWNGRNPIGSGNDTQDGLTTFGREAVCALEDAKIVVDASHLNPPSFYDLLDIVRRPFVASHSNSRAVCDVPRNLTDDQFRMVRDAGGLVGLNLYAPFIGTSRSAGRGGAGGRAAARGAGDAAAEPGEPTFDDLAAHVEHFLDLGGADVVALGTDFDGAPTPSWVRGVQDVPALYAHMRARFGTELARKVMFDNARDFFVRNDRA